MKNIWIIASFCILLAACEGATSQTQSSRTPQGNTNAAVVIWNFSDLQCPACRSAHARLSVPIMEEFGNDIAFHFMHFPLRSIHRYAMEAALASECAADQGAFWPYVDLAFENQAELDSDILVQWANELNLDTEKFTQCLDSEEKRDAVLSDYENGRKLDVAGTPTYFINGVKVQSDLETMRASIQSELDRLTQKL